MLRGKSISYIVAGESAVDLAKAVNLLGKHFGIRRLLLGAGGQINNAFLQADLVDEVSLLLVPGIDGRREVPAVFDGVNLCTESCCLAQTQVDRAARKRCALTAVRSCQVLIC